MTDVFDRRTFLGASATAALLAGGGASFAQLPQTTGAPAGPGAAGSRVKTSRLDASILLIGIDRQETERVNFSTVVALGRAFYLLDHDNTLRVGVLHAEGPDFVGGVLDVGGGGLGALLHLLGMPVRAGAEGQGRAGGGDQQQFGTHGRAPQ